MTPLLHGTYLFFVGFVFSFIGSIPPGTLNISALQLGMLHRIRAAFYFALAACLVEYVYAFAAVRFQVYLTTNSQFTLWFKVISGSVMVLLGVVNLMAKPKPEALNKKQQIKAGFKKGVALSVANPLAIPFWLMVTAYLQNSNLITLSNNTGIAIYVAGISAGTFLLLFLVAILYKKFAHLFKNSLVVYRLPGALILAMGLYAFFSLLS